MKNYLHKLFAAWICMACVWIGTSTFAADAIDVNDRGRVSAVVELSDSQLQALLQSGVFKFAIPYSLRNKVNSLILKRPDRFKDDIAVRFNEVDKRSNTVAIHVDDATIDQIAYQPVELKIYESGYTNVLVRYRPGNAAEVKKPSKSDSVVLRTILKNGKSLTGRLFETKQFQLESGLGDVKVKLKEVSEITVQEDGDLKVTLLDGDTITGEPDFSSLTINSKWGLERIKLDDISSIVAPLTPAEGSSVGASVGAAIYKSSPRSIASPSRSVPQSTPKPMTDMSGHNPHHQFPATTGRVDTLPASPRQIQQRSLSQNVPHSLPSNSFYGTQVMPQNGFIDGHQVYGNQVYGNQVYGNQIQGHQIYGTHIYSDPIYGAPAQPFSAPYGQPLNPIPSLPFNSELPVGHLPAYQIPMSEFPIGSTPYPQPLPLMNPNQAGDSWLYPQN